MRNRPEGTQYRLNIFVRLHETDSFPLCVLFQQIGVNAMTITKKKLFALISLSFIVGIFFCQVYRNIQLHNKAKECIRLIDKVQEDSRKFVMDEESYQQLEQMLQAVSINSLILSDGKICIDSLSPLDYDSCFVLAGFSICDSFREWQQQRSRSQLYKMLFEEGRLKPHFTEIIEFDNKKIKDILEDDSLMISCLTLPNETENIQQRIKNIICNSETITLFYYGQNHKANELSIVRKDFFQLLAENFHLESNFEIHSPAFRPMLVTTTMQFLPSDLAICFLPGSNKVVMKGKTNQEADVEVNRNFFNVLENYVTKVSGVPSEPVQLCACPLNVREAKSDATESEIAVESQNDPAETGANRE